MACPKECQTTMLWQHHHQPSAPSTNRLALDWLRHNVPQGPVLFTTDHQTEGRGQRNRRWSSEAGRDVCMSLAMPVQPDWRPSTLNMCVSLAVRDALTQHRPPSQSNGAVMVKWPNDILVWHGGEHRKAAGILVENVWRGSQWAVAVIGIGVNVNSSRLTRSYPAISLSEAWNVEFNPESITMGIVEHVIQQLQSSTEDVDLRYHDVLFGLNENRTFVVHERTWQGIFKGVNREGRGRFAWLPQPEMANQPPAEWLDSSEVQWCW